MVIPDGYVRDSRTVPLSTSSTDVTSIVEYPRKVQLQTDSFSNTIWEASRYVVLYLKYNLDMLTDSFDVFVSSTHSYFPDSGPDIFFSDIRIAAASLIHTKDTESIEMGGKIFCAFSSICANYEEIINT